MAIIWISEWSVIRLLLVSYCIRFCESFVSANLSLLVNTQSIQDLFLVHTSSSEGELCLYFRWGFMYVLVDEFKILNIYSSSFPLSGGPPRLWAPARCWGPDLHQTKSFLPEITIQYEGSHPSGSWILVCPGDRCYASESFYVTSPWLVVMAATNLTLVDPAFLNAAMVRSGWSVSIIWASTWCM